MIKENYYTAQSDIYMILLEETVDEDLIMKTKLNLLKRDIMNTRKVLKYNFWDELKVILDSNTINEDNFSKWKEYFEEILNSKVCFEENIEKTFEFNYNDEVIKYFITE